MQHIQHHQGRSLFGSAAEIYQQSRSDYPAALYQFILAGSKLGERCKTLEIGPGTGIASIQLSALGAKPLVLLEPDQGFNQHLNTLFAKQAEVEIIQQAFEDWFVEPASFDLVVAATSFHWLEPKQRLQKIAQCLKVSGQLALLWNCYVDEDQQDEFHNATQSLLSGLPQSPSEGANNVSFALDVNARAEEFARHSCFGELRHKQVKWCLQLTTAQLVALYSTFSVISSLSVARQQSLLKQLADIADHQFGGLVTRNMTSIIYMAQKIKNL